MNNNHIADVVRNYFSIIITSLTILEFVNIENLLECMSRATLKQLSNTANNLLYSQIRHFQTIYNFTNTIDKNEIVCHINKFKLKMSTQDNEIVAQIWKEKQLSSYF